MYREVCAGAADACDLIGVANAILVKTEDFPEKQQLATILRAATQRLQQSTGKAEELLLDSATPE